MQNYTSNYANISKGRYTIIMMILYIYFQKKLKFILFNSLINIIQYYNNVTIT